MNDDKNVLVRTHTGMITYLDKDKVPLMSYVTECCSNVRYALNEKSTEYIVVHIAEQMLKAIGRTPFGLLAWTQYLTKIGLPCEMWSIKPEPASLHKNYKSDTFLAASNYSVYRRMPGAAKTEPIITKDLFYKVIIPLAEYRKNKEYWQFVTWTLIRYFYSTGYCNLVDYTFMFKEMFPVLDRVQCLMMAHAGTQKSHYPNVINNVAYGSYNNYTAYHGLVAPHNKLMFINQKTFLERLTDKATNGSFVNNFASLYAKDNRMVCDLFNEGKFEELYKLALKDEK